MSVTRFGVSLDSEILKALDSFVVENRLPNRSQAIRHLVEKNIVETKWLCNRIVAGAIILLYDHHKGDIVNRTNDIQHDYSDAILSSLHFHLDNNKCLEIVAVKGKAHRLTELSDKLIGLKGIIHGKLVMGRTE
ncbi:MAG: nickel-responsive transcriptional regulator NikR [Bacteroidales bacterium]|nr:nickel-responsive transcriptional regulator NikR [Bacteroidales bacterium]